MRYTPYAYVQDWSFQKNREESIRHHTHLEGVSYKPMAIPRDPDRGDYGSSGWVFVTGATMSRHMDELPQGPWPRARKGWEHIESDRHVASMRARVLYWQLRVRECETTFRTLKELLLKSEQPDDVQIANLEALRAEVLTCRANLRVVELELDPPLTPPLAEWSREQLAAKAAREAAQNVQRNRVAAISLEEKPKSKEDPAKGNGEAESEVITPEESVPIKDERVVRVTDYRVGGK